MTLLWNNARRASSWAAFSLIEVVLAISISVVILVVAIYFYHQTSNLRRQLIEETDKLTTVRLLLQKMSSDFRALEGSGAYSFIGNSNSVSFVINENRLMGRWSSGFSEASWPSGLFQVTYQMHETVEGTNLTAIGLVRDERPVEAPPSLPPVMEEEVTNQTAAVTLPAETNSLEAVTNILQAPITQLIKRLEFQYWTGVAWTNAWSDFTPPSGVQILLSTEALPEPPEAPRANAPIFRRTIYIPIGGQRIPATNQPPVKAELL